MKSSTNPAKTGTARKVEKARPSAATPVTASPWQPAWWHWAAGAFLLLLVAFEVYSPALNGEFVFDDSYLPFLMPNVANAPLKYWLGVRPFLMISYWLNFQSSGLNPYPYHAINVFLHVLNSLLVVLIVRRLFGWLGQTGWIREVLAVFSGALFLLHPVQTESVAYVTSRSETMSVLFFLSAFAVFVCRPAVQLTTGRIIAIVLLFGMACATKEHTAVLPVLLLMTDYYFITPFQFTAIRQNLKLYVPIAVAGMIGLIGIVTVLSKAESAGFQIKDFTWYQYLFTQFRVIWLYLRLYVAPYGQNGDYQLPISHSILDGGSLFGLVGLLALAVVAWLFRRKYPLASFGYFGFLLLLAPTSSFVPIRDAAVERRLYLPFLCLLLITVDFLRRWKMSRALMVGTLSAVCAVAGVLSYQRNQVWSNALTFWGDTADKSPANGRARFQLAYAQWQAGQCEEAITNYERASKLDKPDDRLFIDWALALDCVNRPDEAIAKAIEALKIRPSAHIFALVGMIHGKRGHVQEALHVLGIAEKADPKFEMTYVYRGNVYASQGQKAEAIAEYKRALAINPHNEAAQQALQVAQQPAR